MKAMFFPFICALFLATCGNRSANSAPTEQFTAPVEELALALEATEPVTAEPSTVISWDKTVHDFGDVSVTDGPLSCSFTLTNIGKEPIAIYEVVSSCGCTDVKWTREPIQSGKSGTISATYKNEDGPNAFDKVLTVYISGVQRPVVLRLRGIVHEKKKSLSELYGTEKIGELGVKSRQIKASNLKQGLEVSENVTVANLGKKPLEVSFADVSPELSLAVTPNPIPAGSTATLNCSVRSNPGLYGKNSYAATPVLNGKKAGNALEVVAWTQENFAAWSDEARSDAALPYFDNSTLNIGSVKAGESLEVEFTCTNRGKSSLHFYKADTEHPALQPAELQDIDAQKKGSVRFTLDTSLLPKGENVIMISLTTNAPLRPLINLFVAGEVR